MLGLSLVDHPCWAGEKLAPSPSRGEALPAPLPSAHSYGVVPANPEAPPRAAVPHPPPPLELADFEQMALRGNPTLAQVRHRIAAARGEQLQAGLYPNPVVGYSGEEMGDHGTAGKQGGFIGQEFVTAGKLRLNRAVVAHEIVRREQEFAAQQYRVLTDVRVAFFAALVGQQRVAVAEQLTRIGREGVETTEALLRVGEASRVGLLQARVEANQANILLDNARNEHLAAWRRLSSVAGMADAPPAPLLGELQAELAALDWDETLASITAASPEIAAAAAEVQQARCAVERARAGRYPNVEARASMHQDNSTGDAMAGLEVGVALPLFDRNQGNIQRAYAELAAAQRNLERLQLALRQRLAAAFQDYASAKQQAERYRDEILPDAKDALELVMHGYRSGDLGYLDLLAAQQAYFQSSLAHLESLLQMHASRARIEGFLLSESLEPPR
jgi:outer membrane protein, heavy metal efflux system